MNPRNYLLNQLEYVLRPSNVLNRWKFNKSDKHVPVTVSLSNNLSLRIRLCEPVGRALFNYRVFDMSMSEAVYRLVEPGEKVLDVGANVGYITLIMSLKTSPENISSFEPHPTTYSELSYNIHDLNKLKDISLYNIGLSSKTSEMNLITQSEDHRGGSTLDSTEAGTGSIIKVQVKKLDDIVQEQIGVMKIDVEGHEMKVFEGASNLFEKKMIRDVIFEEHRPYPEDTYEFLENYGYQIYRITKSFSKPVLVDKTNHSTNAIAWEPQNYLATLDPQRAFLLFKQKGWHLI